MINLTRRIANLRADADVWMAGGIEKFAQFRNSLDLGRATSLSGRTPAFRCSHRCQ
ncbi:hypothetical protein AGRA3207_004622 [Actinomadura graeca]|uniref:Uncharacterized protein n=1 Tax=Actinomadura graeca TaxID=2750812 RepID=A0ABX8QZN0_9ACTN|nr:hypothetical protein [Actinomadura graeca]QXJ23469.1 hypothetical protein AGRA3207_004622 [Actinomadura graeca]